VVDPLGHDAFQFFDRPRAEPPEEPGEVDTMSAVLRTTESRAAKLPTTRDVARKPCRSRIGICLQWTGCGPEAKDDLVGRLLNMA
jgi:hypothetical protein